MKTVSITLGDHKRRCRQSERLAFDRIPRPPRAGQNARGNGQQGQGRRGSAQLRLQRDGGFPLKRRSDTIGILLPSPDLRGVRREPDGDPENVLGAELFVQGGPVAVLSGGGTPRHAAFPRAAHRRAHPRRAGHEQCGVHENAGGGGHPLHHPVGSAGRKRELYRHRQRAVHLYECQIPH